MKKPKKVKIRIKNRFTGDEAIIRPSEDGKVWLTEDGRSWDGCPEIPEGWEIIGHEESEASE